MTIENRKLKTIIGKVGGTAGKGSLNYKMTIPSKWANELGITKDDRDLKVAFDGKKITVEKDVTKKLGGIEMKKDLTVKNLYFSHANSDGTMDLEFEVDGKTVFVRNVEIPDNIEEDYWDVAENVSKAVTEADDEDIEIK